MKRLSALHWLTALALLVGQWGMLVHAGEHPIDGVDDALCVVCVQGHNLQKLQISTAPLVFFVQSVFIPADTARTQTLAAATKRSTIRAPPHSVHN